jgi:hypothetical protein
MPHLSLNSVEQSLLETSDHAFLALLTVSFGGSVLFWLRELLLASTVFSALPSDGVPNRHMRQGLRGFVGREIFLY